MDWKVNQTLLLLLLLLLLFVFCSHLDNIHVDVINLQSTSVAPYQLLPTVPIPLSFTSNTHIMGKARLGTIMIPNDVFFIITGSYCL